jgi:hypothetical protein
MITTDRMRKALREVLEYAYHDEQEHYQCCDSGGRKGHIFRHIALLDQWMAQQSKATEEKR